MEPSGSWSRVAQVFVAPSQRPEPPPSPTFVMRPLVVDDLWLDFPCCARNAEHIRATRGGDWPGESLSWQDDLVDLAFHQREYELGRSFAYILTSPDALEMHGCVYVYPPGHPFDDGESGDLDDDCDAVVNYWVTETSYRAGLHHHLHDVLERWMAAWPFRHPHVTRLHEV